MNTKLVPKNLVRGKASLEILAGVVILALALAVYTLAGVTRPAAASSHREAPLISQDPEADNTDVYAFVSPDVTNTVTIVANYIPGELPNGGPNFYNFADNVLYEVKIDNTGDGQPDVVYQFHFNTTLANPATFLYNDGPISSLDDPNWNLKQFYTITRLEGATSSVLGSNLAVPPVNIGPRSTPNYDLLATAAIHTLGARKFFAGQRDDPFYVDLGSVFDLAGLRPFNSLHVLPLPDGAGLDGLHGLNTHSIIMQVPMTDLTRDHVAPNPSNGTVGIWATASRRAVHITQQNGAIIDSGNWVQVSRLGNPLINEVIIPSGRKDYWNATKASGEKQFLSYYKNPLLTVYENALYPALDNANETGRDDLVGVLLTGLPGFNYTGNAKVDMLRLNMTIPVASNPSRLGPLDPTNADLQGFPNGRRLADDVVDIELRATAEGYGPTLASLYGVPNRSPNNLLGDGVDNNDKPFLSTFPYVASPWRGYEVGAPAPPSYGALKQQQMDEVLNK